LRETLLFVLAMVRSFHFGSAKGSGIFMALRCAKKCAVLDAGKLPAAPRTGSRTNYFAFTQILSAESSSTPATSVLSLTYCNPGFVPGMARNSSRY
jgi:hypothetical protein